MEDITAKVHRLDREVAAHTEQIKTLFTRQECLDEITRAVTVLAEKMSTVEKAQEKIGVGIEELKQAPARKWDLVIAAVIAAIVGGVVGKFMF
jgi:peptide subunit release factor 1 (eRF1)